MSFTALPKLDIGSIDFSKTYQRVSDGYQSVRKTIEEKPREVAAGAISTLLLLSLATYRANQSFQPLDPKLDGLPVSTHAARIATIIGAGLATWAGIPFIL